MQLRHFWGVLASTQLIIISLGGDWKAAVDKLSDLPITPGEGPLSVGVEAYHLGAPQTPVFTNSRVRAIANSAKDVVDLYHSEEGVEGFGEPPTEEEVEQALLWASYPQSISDVKTLVYSNKANDNLALLKATAPFPLVVVSLGPDWKGTFDKLSGFWTYLKHLDDRDVVVLVDAFDVFAVNFDGHELLRRYFKFGRPIVISTEENIFPREVTDQAEMAVQAMGEMGLLDDSAPSRYLNAGGIIGAAWALKKMFNNMREMMAANNIHNLQAYSETVGTWFLHAYDQYELWAFYIRHTSNVYRDHHEPLIALDTEQLIFGSTVLRKENWPVLLHGVQPANHSIDVDFPLVFDAPQSLFEIKACRARFVGPPHFPVFWHGHGPLKGAWEKLRNRLDAMGCFPDSAKVKLTIQRHPI